MRTAFLIGLLPLVGVAFIPAGEVRAQEECTRITVIASPRKCRGDQRELVMRIHNTCLRNVKVYWIEPNPLERPRMAYLQSESGRKWTSGCMSPPLPSSITTCVHYANRATRDRVIKNRETRQGSCGFSKHWRSIVDNTPLLHKK